MIVPPPPPKLSERLAGTQLHTGGGLATILPDCDFETASEAGCVFLPASQIWDESKGKMVTKPAKWAGPPRAAPGKKGLGVVGAANYALHPTTRVLSLSYDLKDGRGRRWWRPDFPNPSDLIEHVARGGLIEAHNSGFEHWIWNYVCTRLYGWPSAPLRQFRCSMAKSRAWALPGALEDVGEVLGIEHGKDSDGERLLRLFSMPQNPTAKQPLLWLDPATHPEGVKLYAYNDRDIVAEAEVSALVPDLSPMELEYWLDDQEINHAGVHIDVKSMHAMCAILDQALEKYGVEMERITGGIRPTELQQLRGWLGAHGVHTDSLDEAAVDSLLSRPPEAMPAICRRAIELRSLAGSASVKKLFAMRNQVSPLGRLHDTYVYHGAHTGRPTGRGVQTVNLPKAGPNVHKCPSCGKWHGAHTMACPWCGVFTMRAPKSSKEWNPDAMMDAFEACASGSVETTERIFGDALHTVAGCLRGLFVADDHEGDYEFISSDFTAIEGVVIACLAGEQWRIDAYAEDRPMYLLSAERMFGTTVEEMQAYATANGHHHPLRQKGKGAELGLGFGGWINALKSKTINMPGTDDELKDLIIKWRNASPAIVHFWGGQHERFQPCEPFGLEGMALQAIRHPGREFPVNRLDGSFSGVHFVMRGDALYCYVPSGGRLTYHRPRLQETNSWRGTSISFEGWGSEESGAKGWFRRGTYSGKLAENVTQKVARDIQMPAIHRCKEAGYDVRMHTYDEIVARVPVGRGSVAELEAIMCEPLEWSRGWPIKAAGGWRGWRYRKA